MIKTGKDTGEVEELKDSDIVCNCNALSKGKIVKAILEKGAKSLEDIQTLTKASTSCGSCAELVEQILRKYIKEKPRRENKIEKIKKELHPFDEKFKNRMKKYFEEGDWQKIPEDDRDIRFKWYRVFYRKVTPGYFMIRIRVPNGRLTYEQAKVVSHLAEKFARGQIEITSRQQINKMG